MKYSPKENHLAIVYSERHGYNRFKGFIDESQRVWLGPKFFTRLYVLKEHYLGPRTAQIHLSNVLTMDRIYLELDLKVFYRVDPRKADPANLVQVVNMPATGFEGIVKTNTEEKVRNDAFIRFTEDELFGLRGRKNLRTALSSLISERVSGFGITVDPRFGVAVMNIQPNQFYQQAMLEESAATSQGNAAFKRVAPTLRISAQQAQQLPYTHVASTMTKTGTMPSTLYMPQSSEMIQNESEQEGPQPKKRRGYKYPIAAD